MTARDATAPDAHEQPSPAQIEAARLRTGLRWLLVGSFVALFGLVSWSILSAANGWPAGMIAASTGSVAVVVAATTGYVGIKARLAQLATAEPAEA